MDENKKNTHAMKREFDKNYPPVDLEEFLCELHLAMDVFFEGSAVRDGKTITLRIPNGQKFRITAELEE